MMTWGGMGASSGTGGRCTERPVSGGTGTVRPASSSGTGASASGGKGTGRPVSGGRGTGSSTGAPSLSAASSWRASTPARGGKGSGCEGLPDESTAAASGTWLALAMLTQIAGTIVPMLCMCLGSQSARRRAAPWGACSWATPAATDLPDVSSIVAHNRDLLTHLVSLCASQGVVYKGMVPTRVAADSLIKCRVRGTQLSALFTVALPKTQ